MKKTYLDLSTGHLSRGTMCKLDDYGTVSNWAALGWPAISLGVYPAGYFVTVPDFMHVTSEQMRALPGDLATCLLHAVSEGAEMIRFDADGHIDGDLPYYQEI